MVRETTKTSGKLPPASPSQQTTETDARAPDEPTRPLTDGLVVLRNRVLSPYHDLPVFLGRSILGNDPGRGSHYPCDLSLSKEHTLIVAKDEGR